MFKKKENDNSKEFTKVLKLLGKMDPKEVRGFIILVQGKNHEGGKISEGLNAVVGAAPVLFNLLANMDQDIIRYYVKADLLRRITSDK